MNRITVGKIIKAFGIKGEVKVMSYSDDINRFKKLRLVYVDGIEYKIIACRINEGFVYLKFIGIDDRNKSETLVNKDLQINREDAVELEEGRYFITDLISCRLILSTGETVGTITEINQYGAADVFSVFDGKKKCSFPFIKKLNSIIDIEARTMIVDAKAFEEVCVYEN